MKSSSKVHSQTLAKISARFDVILVTLAEQKNKSKWESILMKLFELKLLIVHFSRVEMVKI